jgi:hypothetical protein
MNRAAIDQDSGIEHAPAPRGSPQLPHGAGEALMPGEDDEDATANVDSSRSRSPLLQDGHSCVVDP